MPDNKIVANVDNWGTISSVTIESSDPEFVLATIQKLKQAMPTHGPPAKKPRSQNPVVP